MNVVCLVMDHLHAGYLGAYGNSWNSTPEFDRLASEGLVFDQALAAGTELERLYDALWYGRHPLEGGAAADGRLSLASLLGGRGIETLLLADDPPLIEYALAHGIDAPVELLRPAPRSTVESLEETHLARCFMELIDRVEGLRRPTLVWCHLASLGRVWDAPLEFRRQFALDDDPQPDDSAVVPAGDLPAGVDPDEILLVSQAYAAQLMAWDQCLGALLESLDQQRGEPTLVVVLGARGLLLGEHRRLGPAESPLHAPLVQVPWVMRFPDALAAGERTQALVQSGDLYATLLDWWQVPVPSPPVASRSLLPLARDERSDVRDRLVVAGPGGEWGLRTPAWYLRRFAGGSQLYVKPDDRWEANDVAPRCQRAIEALDQVMEVYRAGLARGTLENLAPLDEISLHGLE